MSDINNLAKSAAGELSQVSTPIISCFADGTIHQDAFEPTAPSDSPVLPNEPTSPVGLTNISDITPRTSPALANTRLFIIHFNLPALGMSNLRALIDTSATSNLIRADIVPFSVPTTTWYPESRVMYGGGVDIAVHGNVSLKLKLRDSEWETRLATHEFRMVTPIEMYYDMVLGMSWIHCSNIDIDIHEQKLHWRPDNESPYRHGACQCPIDHSARGFPMEGSFEAFQL